MNVQNVDYFQIQIYLIFKFRIQFQIFLSNKQIFLSNKMKQTMNTNKKEFNKKKLEQDKFQTGFMIVNMPLAVWHVRKGLFRTYLF